MSSAQKGRSQTSVFTREGLCLPFLIGRMPAHEQAEGVRVRRHCEESDRANANENAVKEKVGII